MMQGPPGQPSNIPGPTGAPSTITGPTGASFTGPTGAPSNITGPTGASITGPTGASITGPTGASSIASYAEFDFVGVTTLTTPQISPYVVTYLPVLTGTFYLMNGPYTMFTYANTNTPNFSINSSTSAITYNGSKTGAYMITASFYVNVSGGGDILLFAFNTTSFGTITRSSYILYSEETNGTNVNMSNVIVLAPGDVLTLENQASFLFFVKIFNLKIEVVGAFS